MTTKTKPKILSLILLALTALLFLGGCEESIIPIRIEIETNENRIEVVEGQSLELDALSFFTILEDGTKEEIDLSQITVSGFDSNIEFTNSEPVKQTLTFTYNNLSVNFDIYIVPKVIESITVLSSNAKTRYLVNEALDLTGYGIFISYESGETKKIDLTKEYIANYDELPIVNGILNQSGNFSFSVEYRGILATNETRIVVSKHNHVDEELEVVSNTSIVDPSVNYESETPNVSKITVSAITNGLYKIIESVDSRYDEDALNSLEWRLSNEFTDLKPDTEYTIFALQGENNIFNRGKTYSMVVNTVPVEAPQPVIVSYGYNYIEVAKEKYVKYILNRFSIIEILENSVKFTNLEPNQEYTVTSEYVFNFDDHQIIKNETSQRLEIIDNPFNPFEEVKEVIFDNKPVNYNVTLKDEFRHFGDIVTQMTFNDSTVVPIDVGTYQVKLKHRFSPNVLTVGTLVIKKLDVLIKVNDLTKAYYEDDPTFSYQVNSGIPNNFDLNSVNTSFVRSKGESVGTYQINASLSHKNLNFTITPGTLTINKKVIYAQVNDTEKVYGDILPNPTYKLLGETPKFHQGHDQAFIPRYTYATEGIRDNKYLDSGIYLNEINLELTNSCYEVVVNNRGSIIVGQRPITVTIHNKEKTYGAVDPALTYELSNENYRTRLGAILTREAGNNVGSYQINLQGYNAANFVVTLVPNQFVIKKAAITFKVNNIEVDYGNSYLDLASVSITSGWLVANDKIGDFDISYHNLPSLNVGTYTLGANIINSNYDITVQKGTVDIVPREINIVPVSNQKKVYGENDPVFDYSIYGLMPNDTCDIVLSREVGEDAGTYQYLLPTEGLNPNYIYTLQDVTFEVTRRDATVTVTEASASKYYGDLEPTYEYTFTNLFKPEDKNLLEGKVSRRAGEDAGVYPLSIGSLKLKNYNLILNTTYFVINKKVITINFNLENNYTYGEFVDLTKATSEGLLPGHQITLLGFNRNNGSHEITATIKNQSNETVTKNYMILNPIFNLAIAKAELIVQPQNITKVYGSADPIIRYNIDSSTLKYDDDESVVSGNLERISGENVGNYDLIMTNLHADNYNIVLESAKFSITPKSIEVKYQNDYTYNQNTQSIVILNDASDLISVTKTTPSVFKGAGMYQITFTTGNPNYTLSNGVVNVEIKKKDITIQVDNKRRKTDEENPVFTADLSGLANLDEVFDQTDLVFATNANNLSPIGTYDIDVTSGFTSLNYNFIYQKGQLTISPAEFNYQLESDYTYDGSRQDIGIVILDNDDNDITENYNLDKVYQGGLNPIDAGNYVVDITITDKNNPLITFTLEEVVQVIKPRLINVDYGINLPFHYGDPFKPHDATCDNLLEGHRIELTGNVIGVGLKTINVKVYNNLNHDITSNYTGNLSYLLEVLKADLTITPTKLSKIYGELDGTLTYRADGLKLGESSSVITGILTRESGEDFGDYEFIISGMTADNYNLILNETYRLYKINKRQITVTYNLNSTYTYGDEILLSPTVQANLLAGHSVSFNYDELVNAGNYVVKPVIKSSETVDVTKNYAITNGQFNVLIQTKELLITSNNFEKVYGTDDPAITYTVSGYVNSESNLVNGNLSRTEGEVAGTYDVLIGSVQSESTNYHLRLVPNTFSINQKNISFNFNQPSYIYSGQVINVTLSTDDLASNDHFEILNNTFVDAGTYNLQVKITSGQVDVTSSYNINLESLKYTITPKTISNVTWSYNNTIARATSTDLVIGETFTITNNEVLIPGVHTAVITDDSNYVFVNELHKSYEYTHIGTIIVDVVEQNKVYSGQGQKYDIAFLEALGLTVTELDNELQTNVNNYPVQLKLSKQYHNDLIYNTYLNITQKEVTADFSAYLNEYVFSNQSYLNDSNVILSESLPTTDYNIKNYQLVNGVIVDPDVTVSEFKDVGTYRVVYTITNSNYKASEINYKDITIIQESIKVSVIDQLLIDGEPFVSPNYTSNFVGALDVTYQITDHEAENTSVNGLKTGSKLVEITKILIGGIDCTNQFIRESKVFEYTKISKDYLRLKGYNKTDLDYVKVDEHDPHPIEAFKNPIIGFGYRYENSYYSNKFNINGLLNPNFNVFSVATNYCYKFGNLNPATIYVDGLIDLESLEFNNIRVAGTGVTLLGLTNVDLTQDGIHELARTQMTGLKVTFSQPGKQTLVLAYEKYGQPIILAKLNIEVVDGFTNITKYEELFTSNNLTKQNLILNNGIAYLQTLGVTINVNAGKTLYGNNYEINSYSAAYSNTAKPARGGKNLMVTAGTIDNVRIIQRKTDSYESAGPGPDSNPNHSINSDTAVTFTNGIIKNSFIVGGRESVEIPYSANVELKIENSMILSGPFGIRRRGGGRLIVEDTKVISRPDKDIGGMGIPIVFLNNEGYKINELDFDNIYLDLVGDTKIYAFETKANIKDATLPFGVKDVVGGIIDDLWTRFQNQLVYTRMVGEVEEEVMSPAVMFVSPSDIKADLEARNPISNFATVFQHAYKNITLAAGYGYVFTYNHHDALFTQEYIDSEGLLNPPAYHSFKGEYKGD
ncbi:MAG: MBG domain-containing protein [Acholeplasmataceae bacterium]|jgi:hypothetical protein